MGRMDSRKGRICFQQVLSSTLAVEAASYRLPPKMSQPVKTMSSSLAMGTKSRINGLLASVALAETDGSHLGERADWLGETFADRLYAGDESGTNRSHTDRHNSKFPFSWLDACPRLAWRLPV